MRTLPAVAFTILVALGSPLEAIERGAKIVKDDYVRAMNANDADAIADLYATDARLWVAGGDEIVGRDAIRTDSKDLLHAFRVVDYRIREASYETSGDLSVGWGRWSLTMSPRNGEPQLTVEGRFTSVARRIKGRWVFVADHSSALLPPSAADRER